MNESYLVYGRLDILGDMSYLAKQGTWAKGKVIEFNETTYKSCVKNLVSGSLYIYQVGNDKYGWSPIYSFLGPVLGEERYPNLAVLGQISSSNNGFTVLSQLIARVNTI